MSLFITLAVLRPKNMFDWRNPTDSSYTAAYPDYFYLFFPNEKLKKREFLLFECLISGFFFSLCLPVAHTGYHHLSLPLNFQSVLNIQPEISFQKLVIKEAFKKILKIK